MLSAHAVLFFFLTALLPTLLHSALLRCVVLCLCVPSRWCLGKVGEAPKTGVVIFSPPSTGGTLSQEQRHIGVVADTPSSSSQQVYWFRGSWLQRAGRGGEKSALRAGDRVQLNPSTWAFSGEEHGQKCLCGPSEGAYGLVVNRGAAQKDGSLRNMEVGDSAAAADDMMMMLT